MLFKFTVFLHACPIIKCMKYDACHLTAKKNQYFAVIRLYFEFVTFQWFLNSKQF